MSRCHARRSPRLGCGVAHPAVAAALAMLWCALAADAAAGSEYGEPKRVGTIDAPALSELSGLAASRETPGVFWVVNDGGHGARLYAISRRGTMLAQFEVPDAKNRDWEALAVVSRPGRRAALYVGDIGDNAGGRETWSSTGFPSPSCGRVAWPGERRVHGSFRFAIRTAGTMPKQLRSTHARDASTSSPRA